MPNPHPPTIRTLVLLSAPPLPRKINPMSRGSNSRNTQSKADVNLLNAFIGARKRADESLTHAQRRLAADLNYSDSAIKRAVKNEVVSERLRTALLEQLDNESKYTKRTIYYATRLMNNAKGKRLNELRKAALKESVYFRGRVRKYRNKVKGEFTKRALRAEREKLEASGLGVFEDVIFDTDVTPSA